MRRTETPSARAREEWIEGGAWDRWKTGEYARIADFKEKLGDLTAKLATQEITEKDFFDGLKGDDGQDFRTFVPADQTPWKYIVERQKGNLLVSSRQGERPQVTARIRLSEAGNLFVGEVSARFLYPTGIFESRTGDDFSEAGASLLQALKRNFDLPKKTIDN